MHNGIFLAIANLFILLNLLTRGYEPQNVQAHK